ncbi:membrane protein insertion efficiency factor YidD [Candidatus Uhrbacteria bacterium]|nr:membrane protein insertion efficiency factor YidD [Candidatus Uhrbacteria bacterium]
MIWQFFPKYIALRTIRLYQKTLSFDHGIFKRLYPSGFCRFHPTCSEYGYQAVERFGVLHGGWLAIGRIIRCNPFSKGGIDEVPKQ